MSYQFHNFWVPEGFSSDIAAVAAAFVARARYFDAGPMPADCWDINDPRGKVLLSAVCYGGCDIGECGRCLNSLRFRAASRLRDIARFEAMERWVRLNHQLPDSYQRPHLSYRDRQIPGNLHDHPELVRVFRTADPDSAACWCDGGRPCDCSPTRCGVTCKKCIYCNNVGSTWDYSERAAIFAEYATACGYVVDREAGSDGPLIREEPITQSLAAALNAPGVDSEQVRQQLMTEVHVPADMECWIASTVVGNPAPIITGQRRVEIPMTQVPLSLYEPLKPTTALPDDIPDCADFRKILENFNKGYACWCAEGVSCDRFCQGCGLSEAHTGSVDAFAAWAKENGWEVFRPDNDHYMPEVHVPEKPEINYSMTTDSLDDPCVCPRLKPTYIVGLDCEISSGVGRRRTRWLLVWGDAPASSRPGDYYCVALAVDSGQVNLGYGYTLSREWDDADSFNVGMEHISSVHPLVRSDGYHAFANNGDVINIMEGRSNYKAWVRAEE